MTESTASVIGIVVYLFFVLLFSLIPAIITAVIASKKGFSVIGWFFIGLFMNWIGIVIVFILKPSESFHQPMPQNRPNPYQKAPVISPYTAGYNPYHSDTDKQDEIYNGLCPHCGGYVSSSLCTSCNRTVSKKEAVEKIQKKFCPSCKKEVNTPFCPYCGTKQSMPEEAE